MTEWLVFLALALLVAGGFFRFLALGKRRASGLPRGRIVYGDTADWNRVDVPLLSRRYGLVGKPDYLVEQEVGGQLHVVPVEVKSRSKPPVPYASHILQLGAYCLLVEDTYKVRPAVGLLHYTDATVEIPFDDSLRRQVIDAAAEIRRACTAADVARHHQDPARCLHCSYQRACGDENRLHGDG